MGCCAAWHGMVRGCLTSPHAPAPAAALQPLQGCPRKYCLLYSAYCRVSPFDTHGDDHPGKPRPGHCDVSAWARLHGRAVFGDRNDAAAAVWLMLRGCIPTPSPEICCLPARCCTCQATWWAWSLVAPRRARRRSAASRPPPNWLWRLETCTWDRCWRIMAWRGPRPQVRRAAFVALPHTPGQRIKGGPYRLPSRAVAACNRWAPPTGPAPHLLHPGRRSCVLAGTSASVPFACSPGLHRAHLCL